MASQQAHAQWLIDELPRLERAGVIDRAAAGALQSHYAAAAAATLRPALALVISGVLGVALVGLGVILLIAHNWDTWSRATRTVISLAPLALTQALSLWVLLRRAESTTWRESAATAQALAVAAAIALIGQTYHLYGNLDDYLLTCALLSLPLAYVLRSVVIGAGYALLIGAWAWQTSSWLWLPVDHGAALYPALLLLVLPAVGLELRRERHSARSSVLLWSVAISLAIGLPPVLSFDQWTGAYAALFAAFCLADAQWFDSGEVRFGRPLGLIGRLGVAALALAYAAREGWNELEHGFLPPEATPLQLALPVFLVCSAAVLWLLAWRQRDPGTLAFGVLPALVLAAPAMGGSAALILFNLYAALLAFLSMRQGFARQKLRTLNFGLAIAAALVLMRFLDSDLSYTVRGVGFMLVGAAVLAANVLVVRMRRGPA